MPPIRVPATRLITMSETAATTIRMKPRAAASFMDPGEVVRGVLNRKRREGPSPAKGSERNGLRTIRRAEG